MPSRHSQCSGLARTATWASASCRTVSAAIPAGRRGLERADEISTSVLGHSSNSRKGYMTTTGHNGQGIVAPPTAAAIWAIPPQTTTDQEVSSHNHSHSSRLFNPSAPPPVFNVSSLQAPPAPSRGRFHQKQASHSARAPSLALLEENAAASESTLDAAKRKNLPAWIR